MHTKKVKDIFAKPKRVWTAKQIAFFKSKAFFSKIHALWMSELADVTHIDNGLESWLINDSWPHFIINMDKESIKWNLVQ